MRRKEFFSSFLLFMDLQIDLQQLEKMLDELHQKALSLAWDEKEIRKQLFKIIGEGLHTLRYNENLSRHTVNTQTEISISSIKRAEKGEGSSDVLNGLFQLYLENNEACKHPQRVAIIFLCKLLVYLPRDAQLFTDSTLLKQLLEDLLKAATCPSHFR